MTLEFIFWIVIIYLLFGNKLINEEEQDDADDEF